MPLGGPEGSTTTIFSCLTSLLDVLCLRATTPGSIPGVVPLLRHILEVVSCNVAGLGRLERQLMTPGTPRDERLASTTAQLMACHLDLPALCDRLPRVAQVLAHALPGHVVSKQRSQSCVRCVCVGPASSQGCAAPQGVCVLADSPFSFEGGRCVSLGTLQLQTHT